MSSHSQPSIFTSRRSFHRRPDAAAPTSTPTSTPQSARVPHSSSPSRRQSTPEALERNRIQAAAEAAPIVPGLPERSNDHNATTTTTTSADDPDAVYSSIWSSFTASDLQPPAASAFKGRSVSASHARVTTPPPGGFARPYTPTSARKRAGSPRDERGPTSEPSTKRQKPNVKPRSKHFLDPFSLPAYPPELQPPSPLFFSNSPRPRPTLPPRFSSSEAAAKMLSKARNEDSHVKTVSLARGVVTTPNLPTSVPQQYIGSRSSAERYGGTGSSSPEPNHGGKEMGHMLNSIGVIELLEQDERPTFIVDLADRQNYGEGPLRLVFANSSMRSYTGLESLVSGSAPDYGWPGAGTYLQFKMWLMSAAVNGESLNVCLPSFVYANMSWSCSTLRKRLRIISGAFIASPRSGNPPTLRSSIPPPTSADIQPLDAVLSSRTPANEPNDYFGSAMVQPLSESSSILTEAIPTIELLPSAITDSVTMQEASPMDITDNTTQFSHDDTAANDLHPNAKDAMVDYSMATVPASIPSPGSYETISPKLDSPPDVPSFDWTRLPISDSMPQHIRFARSIDWASTPLGPIENWDADLRQMCNLIMASPHPAAMYWGEHYVAIYNEAYVLLAGQKHPALMGRSYSEAWAEIWDEVKDVFASARLTGEATMKDDDCLFIRRNDYLEETYFSWSIIPMVGKDGLVMGLYNPAFEKTRRKVAERRMLTLREVGERTASARDVKAFWAQVLGSFEFNEVDSPFLLLYSVADDGDSDGSSSVHSNSVHGYRPCVLEGKLAVPDGHPAAPEQIDLKNGTEGFGPAFREIMRTDKPVVLEVGGRDLPEHLVHGLTSRGFGDPMRAVVVCPIHPTTGESILGFLVLGVNPRRPYDDDYSLFVQLLSRQLATSLASVVLFEEEIRRGQRAAKLAALDRIELSEQLAQRTQEAIESETKFTRMAEFAPVGMFIAGSDGKITFANDTWYDISRVVKNKSMADTWMDSVYPDDRVKVQQLWEDLTLRKKPVSSEFRFKAQWEDRSGTRGDTWVLFSGYPEKHADGRLKSIFGSITNISQQKWAEGIQTRKMEEAVELKRQQENFIDITSHEMRNPLSAILQCSDEIANSLTTFRQSEEREISDELLTSCLDAAQIISLCSQHQKRIVDDILTLSKLDSQLLLVTPVDAQPLTVVQRALKMHEGELQAADIQMKFIVDQTYQDMGLDWVRFDPSRVLQVLINLTTNAIKFTGSERDRTISVTISACDERPSDRKDAPVKYFPTRRKGKDVADDKDWGDGEKVYIHFAVRDTGRGLNPEEKKMLFLRFSQASPRTHVQYGGSGLGLFISRELTELQGGEIGVESEAGKGSTFAFYVSARRSSAPPDTDGATGMKRTSGQSSANKAGPSEAVKKATQNLAKAAQLPTNGSAIPPKKETPKRVLIVEDNLVNQRVLQKQLKNIGTEVYLANHGGEALDKLQQSTYWTDTSSQPNGKRLDIGVVLMDQEMPVMDGLTCTRKIRELEREGKLSGHVPIIAVTANARAEQVQTALDAGMDDVVSKPFRLPELVPKIEELMEKYPAPSA